MSEIQTKVDAFLAETCARAAAARDREAEALASRKARYRNPILQARHVPKYEPAMAFVGRTEEVKNDEDPTESE